MNSQSSLQNWEFHYVTVNQMANFGNFVPNFVQMWQSNFTIALGCCFEISAFTVKGKAILSFVGQKILESWLEWKGSSQTRQELRLPKQTMAKIVDIFVRRGNIEDIK